MSPTVGRTADIRGASGVDDAGFWWVVLDEMSKRSIELRNWRALPGQSLSLQHRHRVIADGQCTSECIRAICSTKSVTSGGIVLAAFRAAASVAAARSTGMEEIERNWPARSTARRSGSSPK